MMRDESATAMAPGENDGLWLGIDIGGTKLAAGVVTRGQLIGTMQIARTPVEEGLEHTLLEIRRLAGAALKSAKRSPEDLSGIGIGCGGPLDARAGVVYSPPNLPGWDEVPIVGIVGEAFGLEPVLGNDGDVGALAEFHLGSHGVDQSLVYMTISTGCGGGIIVNRKLITGAAGSAAEFGHILAGSDGRICQCGQVGCLEAYASGPAIAAAATRALSGGAESSLASLKRIKAEDVVAHAVAGDHLARAIWQTAIDALASAIRTTTNTLDPEVVVLGGGVTRAGRALFQPLGTAVAGSQFRRPGLASTRIVPSSLGDGVGVLGAAVLAMEGG